MTTTTAPDRPGCPPWCTTPHRHTAHTSWASTFGVIVGLRLYRGEATARLTIDAPKGDTITLDADELTRVIAMLTTHRDRLLRTPQGSSSATTADHTSPGVSA
jgi:hypothetical protein